MPRRESARRNPLQLGEARPPAPSEAPTQRPGSLTPGPTRTRDAKAPARAAARARPFRVLHGPAAGEIDAARGPGKGLALVDVSEQSRSCRCPGCADPKCRVTQTALPRDSDTANPPKEGRGGALSRAEAAWSTLGCLSPPLSLPPSLPLSLFLSLSPLHGRKLPGPPLGWLGE
jgi:hypothetical protein